MGLLARHYWLKYSIWFFSILTLIPALIYIWTEKVYTYEYYDYNSPYKYFEEAPKTLNDYSQTFMISGYIILFGLMIACILSLLYKNASERKFSRIAYWVGNATLITGTIMFALVYYIDSMTTMNIEALIRTPVALSVVSVTSFVMVIISNVTNSVSRKTPSKFAPSVNTTNAYNAYSNNPNSNNPNIPQSSYMNNPNNTQFNTPPQTQQFYNPPFPEE